MTAEHSFPYTYLAGLQAQRVLFRCKKTFASNGLVLIRAKCLGLLRPSCFILQKHRLLVCVAVQSEAFCLQSAS